MESEMEQQQGDLSESQSKNPAGSFEATQTLYKNHTFSLEARDQARHK
jgi:hypothetical protein